MLNFLFSYIYENEDDSWTLQIYLCKVISFKIIILTGLTDCTINLLIGIWPFEIGVIFRLWGFKVQLK